MTQRMQCADENFVEREFVKNDDGDFTCTHCGWMQASAAAGAAELCALATWHTLEEYQRFATIAREGGHTVPEVPPNADWVA